MHRLYFIAVIPAAGLCKKITILKEYIAQKYVSTAALRLPPHITLYPPFRWEEANEKILENSLTEYSKHRDSFSIILNGFGCFKPRVIFIKPEPCQKLDLERNAMLHHLSDSLNLSDKKNERPFYPHITLAYHDLKKSVFYEAWDEFSKRNFSAEFEINSIILLKHDGKRWNRHLTFAFSQENL